jgi:hypothetical protein
MTEQEAWELDDLVTRTEIELEPNGAGSINPKNGPTPQDWPIKSSSTAMPPVAKSVPGADNRY